MLLRTLPLLFVFSAFFANQLPLTAQKEERVINKFIKEHRRGEENFAIKVPGWMFGLAGKIGALAAEDEDERAALRLAREIGTTRVLTFMNDDFDLPEQSVENLLYSLENYHGFDRWAEIRTREGERVTISAQLKGDVIKRMIVLVNEGEQSVFLSARTDLSADELGRLIEELTDES